VHGIGSSPAYSEQQLAGFDEGRKQLADSTFVRGYGLQLAPGGIRPSGPAPVPQPTVGAHLLKQGSCFGARPTAGASVVAPLAFTAPPGGVSLHAPGGSIELRRFADAFGGVPPLEGDATRAILRIPRDGSSRPWHVVVQNASTVTACGIETGP
jgi:hypothetical protein